MKNKEGFKLSKYLLILSLLIFFSNGCFPDRVPTDPDYQVQDVRRPGVEHHIPLNDAVSVSLNPSIIVWFDELMELASVRDNFQLWPQVSMDSIQALAISNSDPQIIYAGKFSQGIFKSVDAGEYWHWMSMSSPRMTVNDLAVNPLSTDVVYAATDNGVYKSDNGGTSWQQLNSGLTDLTILAITIDPGNPDVVYLTTRSDGIFKSDNAGLNWVTKNNGVGTGRPIYDIVVDPTDSQILFAATDGNYIMRSIDGAESWTRQRSGFAIRDFYVLAVHPSHNNIIYAGAVTAGIYRSNDGGDSWINISSDLKNPAIRSIVLDPADTNIVILGTSGGVYKNTNVGDNWLTLENELTANNLTTLIANPNNLDILFAGTSDGVFKSSDNGVTWLKITSIQLDELYVTGDCLFETWQDTITIIAPLDSVTNDTTVIVPYIYERALSGWDGIGEPVVETNPKATMLTYIFNETLLPNWKYQVRINGIFQGDKVTLKGTPGARDISGNSFETDRNFTFITGNND